MGDSFADRLPDAADMRVDVAEKDAPPLWGATVSAFVQPANSRACWAFRSSSTSRVKCDSAWPAAMVLMMWVAGS
jgi:hypothetical protein